MVKSDLLKQISYYRPQDVPFMRLILFQFAPITQKSRTFDATNVVTRKSNINQQLDWVSDMSSEPELCGLRKRLLEAGGRGSQMHCATRFLL